MCAANEIEHRLQELGLEVIERHDCDDEYDPYTAFGISDIILYSIGELFRLSAWVEYDGNKGFFTDLYWPNIFIVVHDGISNRILLKSSQLPDSSSIIDIEKLNVILNRLSKNR